MSSYVPPCSNVGLKIILVNGILIGNLTRDSLECFINYCQRYSTQVTYKLQVSGIPNDHGRGFESF